MLMKIDKALDYAGHEIQAKHIMNQAHDLILAGEYSKAAATIDAAIVELRLMRNAVKTHIKE
jgi:hypothetical protein